MWLCIDDVATSADPAIEYDYTMTYHASPDVKHVRL